jgi:hypothetical protein
MWSADMAIKFFVFLFVVSSSLFSCSGSDGGGGGGGSDSEKDVIPTGALKVEGTIDNGDDPDNTDVLADQTVEIIRDDGEVVATTTTDDTGAYNVDLPAGALVIGTQYQLTQDATEETDSETAEEEEEAPSASLYSYTLQVKIPDDGNGKALGIREKVQIAESKVTDGVLNLGTNNLNEVAAIIGTVEFEEATQTATSVDVFIPGKPYFVRTGDDGSFNLFFVPAGDYSIRLVKGNYIKDVEVSVTAGTTLNVGTVTVGTTERNPLPLNLALIGNWDVVCTYYDTAGGVDPDNPKTGSLAITALDSFTITGDSCVMRTMAAAGGDGVAMRVLGDGGIAVENTSGDFFFDPIMEYTNDHIVFYADNASMGASRMIEVWTRTN